MGRGGRGALLTVAGGVAVRAASGVGRVGGAGVLRRARLRRAAAILPARRPLVLTLAALAERSGLAERAAAVLAARARGNTLVLYGLVRALCALLTAAVSLDGAVVLMVPLLLALARRWSVPMAPMFMGVVVVANAASIAVPQGNPTNLVVIDRLGVSPAAFLSHMLVPGLAAATLCAFAVAFGERSALASPYTAPRHRHTSFTQAERHAALAITGAALAAWIAPLIGVAPW
jgi:arsenical pump membrane protein